MTPGCCSHCKYMSVVKLPKYWYRDHRDSETVVSERTGCKSLFFSTIITLSDHYMSSPKTRTTCITALTNLVIKVLYHFPSWHRSLKKRWATLMNSREVLCSERIWSTSSELVVKGAFPHCTVRGEEMESDCLESSLRYCLNSAAPNCFLLPDRFPIWEWLLLFHSSYWWSPGTVLNFKGLKELTFSLPNSTWESLVGGRGISELNFYCLPQLEVGLHSGVFWMQIQFVPTAQSHDSASPGLSQFVGTVG